MKIVFAVLVASLFFCLPSLAYQYNEEDEDLAANITDIIASAKRGSAESEYKLAQAYQNGEGVRKDEVEAAEWYERSANQGYADAQMAMGFIYRGAYPRYMNKILSYMWFDLASKSGDEHAFELRNDVAWSMTEPELEQARKLSSEWKPGGKGEPLLNP